MFSPDFFHRSSKLLGMHSYLENTFDNPVISLQSKNDYQIKNKNIEFVDIMPTVLHSMELPVPSSCQGKILID
jgi:bisphosphoglycerate-independent phosphoglycerate mutase (AlkP superfamily)